MAQPLDARHPRAHAPARLQHRAQPRIASHEPEAVVEREVRAARLGPEHVVGALFELALELLQVDTEMRLRDLRGDRGRAGSRPHRHPVRDQGVELVLGQAFR